MDLKDTIESIRTVDRETCTTEDKSSEMSITYEDLVCFFEQYEASSLNEQQIKNRKSALSQFLDHRGESFNDPIGQTLSDAILLDVLTNFHNVGEKQGLAKGTLDNRKTAIRQWSKTYTSMLEALNAPKHEFFNEAIHFYFSAAKERGIIKTLGNAAASVGLTKTYLNTVLRNRIKKFSTKYLEKIAKLETLLGAPTGSLCKFVAVNPNISLSFNANEKKNSFSFAKRMSSIKEEPFWIKDLNPNLINEIESYIKFKTAISVIPLNRNKSWRLKPKSEFGKNESIFNEISVDGKNFSTTAWIFYSSIKTFFAALSKLGYDETKFSLAYLVDFNLLRQYTEFMMERHGKITKSVLMLLNHSEGLLLKMEKNGKEIDFGFLLQNSKYSGRMLNPVDEKKWREWCASQSQYIKQYINELKEGNFLKVGRDPKEPLQEYLDRDHPITAILEISENIEAYLEKQRPFLNLRHMLALERDLLMFQMFPTQPLRIKMYAIMKYNPDNSGNLYKKSNGEWMLRFDASDFKNQTGAASDKDYNVPIEKYLHPKIDNYLTNVRVLFNDNRENVFVCARSKMDTERNNDFGDVEYLARAVVRRSKQFLPGCFGLGPHGVRHIVATDYIKNNPNGYQIAADILHDRLTTVLKHYAHLKVADGHKYYQEWFKGVRAEWTKSV